MKIDGVGSSLINNTINNTDRRVDVESFEKRLQAAMEKSDEKELKKVCQQFEAVLLNMMYRQMKATVPKSTLIPGDAARDVFESMLDDSFMDEAAKSSGFGLGDALYKQLGKKPGSSYKL